MKDFLHNFYIKHTNLAKIIAIGIFGILTIWNISSVRLYQKALNRFENAESQLDEVKTETAKLNDSIEYTKKDIYLEQVSLERFKLVKDPSTIVIVQKPSPTWESKPTKASDISSKTSNFAKWLTFMKL